MSRDFQLGWACPHLTAEEVVSLGSDRRSLVLRQPVAGSTTVRILVNDELFIPQGGLYSYATLAGTTSGPFDIIPGEDTLTVTTSAGTGSLTFGITTLTRYSADQVIAKLNQTHFIVAAAVNVNGHLAFTDKASVGPSSFVAVSGSAAASLGFGQAGTNLYQRKARGRMIYPGWQVYTPPNLLTSRYPIFSNVIPSDPVFKVTYTVPGNRCLRCGATYVENDVRFDSAGQSVLIENENLLYQAALKMLLTNRGSNPYHPWYGTDIQSRIGSKALSGTAALLTEDVRKALVRLQALQTEQAKYQQVTFKERLYAVDSVQVQQHAQDPMTFLINVTVRNASSRPVNLSIVFTVPSVVALMGSNGLMLGTAAAGLLPDQAAQIYLPLNQG